MSILEGLEVIEISGNGSAAMAAKHFADWGAHVTVLEPEGGTPLRSAPPTYEKDGSPKSAMWQWLSRGKTVIEVPPGEAAARCEEADVVLVESEMCEAVLGLTPAEVRAWLEGTTTAVLIAPFATDGPLAHYRATDMGLHARGGWMSTLGLPDREPLRPGGEILWRVAGIVTFAATLAALRHDAQGGGPQFVEISSQAVAAGMQLAPWLTHSMAGAETRRRRTPFPGAAVECADGYVGFTPLTTPQWEMVCQMLGFDDVLADPHGLEPAYREQHAEELHDRIRPYLMSHTKREVAAEAQVYRIPASPIETAAERLDCPQLEARGFWEEADIDGKTVRVPRVAYSVRGAEPVRHGPDAPRDRAPMPSRPAAGRDAPSLPFAGVRVLDLGHFWAGPAATQLLGALGADVIKVESVQRPDAYRFSFATPGTERWYEGGALFHNPNSNKRNLTLDLGSKEGRALFEQLVPTADVVLNNFSNRVMRNFGLTDERLLELNPRLIVAAMPGYGPGGPWEDWVGWAFPIEHLAVCGSVTGYADYIPTHMGGFCDPLGGFHGAVAIQLALLHRERTGKGTVVEVPQAEVLDSLWAPEFIAVQHGAPVPGRQGNHHAWMAPHNAYHVAGDDEWLTVAVATDGEWQALCTVLGATGLAADARFATTAGRKEHEPALDIALAAAIEGRDGDALEVALQAAGVMACRVVRATSLTEDANLRHIGAFQGQDHAVTGRHPYFTWPFRFSGIDSSHKRPPSQLGEHNREILAELGLGDADLARLEAERIIGTVPAGLMRL